MPRFAFALTCIAVLALAACDNSVEQAIPDPEFTPEGWALVWNDEFDGTEVDTSKWEFQLGDGCNQGVGNELCGWGNNELQSYNAESATVADGLLTITARQDTLSGDTTYTSARLRTLGKGDWTYGRFEVKAKLPTGQGLWPAIWLLFSEPTYGGWAASGEIDIMEAVGSKPGEVFGTLHYGGSFPDNVFAGEEFQLAAGTIADDFFVFTVEWEEAVPDNPDTEEDEFVPTTIRWYINNVLYQTQTSDDWFVAGLEEENPAAPFDHAFHMILNVAVGGNLPGSPDATTVFPQTMQVDYVRVYERSE
ncbi:MAG: glycoside hydrolase family 16 protein [Bacteroidota bacterium]